MQTLPPVYSQNPLLSPQFQTLQWLSQLSPYQQALLLPLLSQNTPLSSPMFIPNKDDEILPGINKESIFSLNHLQQSPLSYCLNDNQMTESTQENSPKLPFYNFGFGMNEGFSLQDKPMYAATSLLANNLPNLSLLAPNSKKIKKQKTNSAKKMGSDSVLTNIRKESCDSVIERSGFKSPTLSAMRQNSASNANNILTGGDDKNIIHINFTKNLLKSFRRYCEYFHKNNQQLLQQIKTDFETNHMNNQLLVHFMTNNVTGEYFQQFVDGPAQKWVKEQSRLKKQDQQLELIEICRQRCFEKIKVKKYCDTASNPIQIEDSQLSASPNMTPIATPTLLPSKKPSSLTAQAIFNSMNASQTVKSALSSSSSSSSECSDNEEMDNKKNYQPSNNRREQCDIEDDEDSSVSRENNGNENTQNGKNKDNVLQEFFEPKIEEIEQAIKIEDEEY